MHSTASNLARAALLLFLASIPEAPADMAEGFQDPGPEARPRAFWNWLNGCVTHEGLTRDLEEAKAKGMAGLEIWDVQAMRNAEGFVPAGPAFLGEESVKAIHHCMREAERLGLVLGMITSSGWNAGGPWVPPELASKNLYVSEQVVKGPGKVERELEFPEVPEACPRNADGLPKWFLDVAVLAWPDAADKVIPDPAGVVDLTRHVKDGKLVWDAPDGTWRVARFVCTNNGQQLIVPSPNSNGPFIDFLDPAATRFHFEHILNRLGLQKGGDPSPLEYLEVDSMELHEGIQWTPKFPDWFRKQHRYDPLAWLPVLAGWTQGDKDTGERFLYDYRKTVSDLLIFSHYTTGSEVCAEYGLDLTGEAGGPGPPIWDSCPVDALKALGNVHVPRGEFWIENRHNIFLVKEIASAANIYGKPYVDAEGWTTWRRWNNSPYYLKQHVDRAFCEGLNRLTYHCFAHSAPEVGRPGYAYHAGVDINPQVTWWSKARPFMDYLSRCCYLLQQGRFVADVAYYYGDQAPNFWPNPHNVPEKPLLPGLGAGFDYDVVNTDVILNRMQVDGDRLVLPGGLSYRVLVLAGQDHMPLEVLKKLEELVAQGATLLGPKPVAVPGLHRHKERTKRLRALADKLWGPCDGKQVKHHRHGKGQVVWGISPREWLQKQSVQPDFTSEGEAIFPGLDFIHRRTEDSDIYFVRNRGEEPVAIDGFFRVKGRSPQFWNPEDGSIRPAYQWREVEGGTRVRLDLAAGGSTFVVFVDGKDYAQVADLQRKGGMPQNKLPPASVVHTIERAATLRCWESGTYSVQGGSGEVSHVEVDGIPAPVMVEGPWDLTFEPGLGAPQSARLDALASWTEHPEEGIRNYSGTATYRRSLEVPASSLGRGRRVYLDLGEVGEVAEVFINGKSTGVLWKPPFRADLTQHTRSGSNDLRIEVTNLWINRLAGDQHLPAPKQITRTNVRQGQSWEALPSGLLGPVRVLTSRDVAIQLTGRGP